MWKEANLPKDVKLADGAGIPASVGKCERDYLFEPNLGIFSDKMQH